MSTDHVNASPSDIRKLARSLQDFENKITEVTKQGRRAIDGAYWHDKQKDRFVMLYKDFQNRNDRFVATEVRQMVKSLNALATELERARDHRF